MLPFFPEYQFAYKAGSVIGTDVVRLTSQGLCGPGVAFFTAHVVDPGTPVITYTDSTTNGCGATWNGDPTNALCKTTASCTSGKNVTYCETTGVGHNVADFAPAAVGAFFAAR